MSLLTCDCCGSSLIMQAGGKIAVCDFCGMHYSMERLQEKLQEARNSGNAPFKAAPQQSSANNEIISLKRLLNKYISSFDYPSALNIAKKILEIDSNDTDANQAYDDLQELQYFDIREGVLIAYTGRANIIRVPNGVNIIAEGAFSRTNIYCKTIIFPNTLTELYDNPIAAEMIIPDTVTKGTFVFMGNSLTGSHGFRKLRLSSQFQHLEDYNIRHCRNLEKLIAPESYIQELLQYALQTRYLAYDEQGISRSPWAKPYLEIQNRKDDGRCQHCGGKFTGLLSYKCKNCGRPKDY